MHEQNRDMMNYIKCKLVYGLSFCCVWYFSNHDLTAQSQPQSIPIGLDCPEYIREIQQDSPNVFRVQDKYREHYQHHPFVKNTYSQFYKHWMIWAQRNMDNQGNIIYQDPTQQEREQTTRLQLRQNRNTVFGRQAPEWKFLGPSSTYHTDGTTKVTWQTNIYSIAIAPSNPNVLYAGGESGGIWKTTDKGIHWELLSANVLHGAFEAIAIHPKNADTVFASTAGKLIRSFDGGLSWQTAYSESGWTAFDIEFVRNNPAVMMAAGNKGLFRSEDGGRTWNKLWSEQTWTLQSHNSRPDQFFAIRQKGNSCEFVFSLDAGKVWVSNAINWYTPLSGTSVTGAILALCESNDQKIYAYLCGQGGTLNGYVGVFVSEDEGLNWRNTNTANAIGGVYSIPQHTNLMAHNGTDGFDQGFYDMAIIVNPNNENELIAGGTSWFKSVNGGQTWTALGSYVGGLPWSHPDLQCLAVSGNDLWIGSDGGLNYSNNFGQSMEARMDGISGADLWGFDGGWNEDILVGGRYHNGNMAWHQSFPPKTFYRMGGAEAATGYVNPGPGNKTYFSDIGGYALKAGLGNGVQYFPVGLFPNESYAYYANSQMQWHPNCWNTVFLGHENKLWKSEDGGSTFQLMYTFPGTADHKVFEIEISRSDPQVMYCSQWDGTDDSMWTSKDGGQSWNKLQALPLPNNNDRVKMTLSAVNPNEIWVAVTYGSNGKKIYYSSDGGSNWLNWTTSLLNDVRVSDILHAYGTDGGVYLGTNRGVYYRNHLMADWLPYSTGLPVSAETNRLKVFYKEGKIRNGCWGFGVWENDLFEDSKVLANIMADKLQSNCLRDTFYFDDISVVKHQNVEWNWNFENTEFVSGEHTRTPKVVFNQPGISRAFMQLTTPQGVYFDTLALQIGDDCDKDSIPGMALQLDGQSAYVQVPSLGLATNSITLMAWVKSTAIQNDWAGLLFIRSGGQAAGLSVLSNGDLRYHWNSGGYNWVSQARLMQNEWTHVALVVEPTSVTIYKNGVPYRHVFNVNVHDFTSPIAIGADLNGGARFFKGLMDEVCIYQRALSQNEIREYMHLARTHTPNNGLLNYYQFNESEGSALDRQGVNHASLNSPAGRSLSTAPIGPGYSHRLDIWSKGTYNYDQTKVEIETAESGVFPNGEVCISRINYIPEKYFSPNANPVAPCYWIMHNYGSNSNFSAIKNLKLKDLGPLSGNGMLSDYQLFKRAPNADTAAWTLSATASSIVQTNPSVAVFENTGVQSESQWLLTLSPKDTILVSTRPIIKESSELRCWVYPNPVIGSSVWELNTNLPEEFRFQLMDSQGRQLKDLRFRQKGICNTTDLPAGSYFGIFQSEKYLKMVQLEIIKP